MRKLAASLAVMLVLICAAPALSQGLGISPGVVEFDVPAEGSATVEFLVHDFSGDLEISLEDIPLTVEPETVHVIASEGGTPVELTFYGDPSLGSQVISGKIRFLALTGGTVATGIKVRATINHIVAGQPLPGKAEAGETEGGGGFSMPTWGWIVIGVGALALVAFIIFRRVIRVEIRR